MQANGARHVYEPAPTGRSKKRKAGQTAQQHEDTIYLVEEVQRGSQRLTGRRLVKLSDEDKADQLKLDDAKLQASSSGGYRSVRATHGAHSRTWYYEVRVDSLGQTGACRIGWATRKCELEAPVGVDENSFAYCSKEGSKVRKSAREDYGSPFKEGDVIGCVLHMSQNARSMEHTIDDVVKYKNRLFYAREGEEVPADTVPASFVGFSLNGEWQGKAYEDDLFQATYYPTISLYTHAYHNENASISVNFGDTPFAYPPSEIKGYDGPLPRPLRELP